MADKRIKLTEPGSQFDMLVSSVKPETIERNDYYLFTNQIALGGGEIVVPQSSVKAQIERLGISSVEEMIGKWVRFGRSTKMSRANKPYWDIDWSPNGSGAEAPSQSAGGEMGKPTAVTPSAAPSADSPATKLKLTDVYMTSSKFVIDRIVPLYMEANVPVDAESVAAMVATLFIAATKER